MRPSRLAFCTALDCFWVSELRMWTIFSNRFLLRFLGCFAGMVAVQNLENGGTVSSRFIKF